MTLDFYLLTTVRKTKHAKKEPNDTFLICKAVQHNAGSFLRGRTV